MKRIFALLFLFVGYESVAQRVDFYTITGCKYDGIDGTTLIPRGNPGRIWWDYDKNLFVIDNVGICGQYVGTLKPSENSDKNIERTSTQYKSSLIYRKYDYSVANEDGTYTKRKIADINIIWVMRPDKTYIDCTLLLEDNFIINITGFLSKTVN